MTDNTRFAKYQLDMFFKSVDDSIEQALSTKDFECHSSFLNYYVRHFPTMGEMVYQHIFNSTELCKYYADYTLQELLKDGSAEVEKKRREYPAEKSRPFYIYYYHKYILKKVKPMIEVGMNPELKRFLDHWQEKLETQGYVFQYNAKESATVRNIAFHLAFALEMDVKTLKDILVKCLLQQAFNPKNHLECIFWYCLDRRISYDCMRREYLDYYRSDTFDEAFRYAPEKGITDIPTLILESDLQKMMKKRQVDFFRYLWRLKYTENLIVQKKETEFGKVPNARALKRKTPGMVYWENLCCFVDMEDSSTLSDPLTEEEYAVRFLEIWRKLRSSCHERNQDPLMDRQTLEELFGNIDYTKRGIENRKWNLVNVSRAEIIATQFLAYCTRGSTRNMPHNDLRKGFLKEIDEELEYSGLRKFYLRSPLELFLMLCFLHEDPFCYFMASWEEAFTET